MMNLLIRKINLKKNWFRYLLYLLIGLMFLSGISQMPISKRYSIDSIPILKWTSDFFVSRYIHYTVGMILLFISAYIGTDYIIRYRNMIMLTPMGKALLAMSVVIVLSGMINSLSTQINGIFSNYILITASYLHIFTSISFIIMSSLVAIKRKKLAVETSS